MKPAERKRIREAVLVANWRHKATELRRLAELAHRKKPDVAKLNKFHGLADGLMEAAQDLYNSLTHGE